MNQSKTTGWPGLLLLTATDAFPSHAVELEVSREAGGTDQPTAGVEFCPRTVSQPPGSVEHEGECGRACAQIIGR